MSRRYGCACAVLAILVALLSSSAANAQNAWLAVRWNPGPTDESCADSVPAELANRERTLLRLRQNAYDRFENACAPPIRSAWSQTTVFPALPDVRIAPPAGDPIENELLSAGPEGLTMAAARQEVLQILREGSACSAWFAQGEEEPAIKFATLHLRADPGGEATIVADDSDGHGLLLREPYVARSQENVGRGSTITLNAHGAFFHLHAPAQLSTRAMISHFQSTPGLLRVSSYLGGSLKAQITTLLHEYAHVVGLLPIDSGLPGSAQLSTENTEVVLRHCRKQIEASPNRTIVLPASPTKSSIHRENNKTP